MTEYVYIAEAYHNGSRIERVVHIDEDDARHDIENLTEGADVHITIDKERLYTGSQ